jgi:integrase
LAHEAGSRWEAAGAVSAVRKLTPPPAAGVHPKVVQERLGHSQVSVTLDTYGHVAPSLQREAADRLDGLLDRAHPSRR